MSDTVIDELVKETRKGFDLGARLGNRNRQEGKHTVFTDDKLAKKVIETVTAIKVAESLAHDAILDVAGEVVVEALEVDTDLVAELTARKDELVKQLRATSMTFHFRAVPEVIVDAAMEHTRQLFGDDDGNISDIKKEKADAHYFARIFADAVYLVEDHATGESSPSINFEDSAALKEQLEPGEWVQLNVAFSNVQFKNTIAHQLTDSPDF